MQMKFFFYHGLILEKRQIHYRKNASEITKHSKSILRKAIDAGGTTLQDFFSPSGNKGYFKVDLNVYDREGEKCFDCSNIIKRIVAKPEVNISL